MIDFLGARLHAGQLENLFLSDDELLWNILSEFTNRPGRESFWWGKVLAFIAPVNPTLAIRLACRALLGGSFDLSDIASNLLSEWAISYPNETMSEVGSVALDPAVGVRFFVAKFSVFKMLPPDVVMNWLTEVGSAGAEKLARHLPPPFIDNDGNPVVPELTAWMLSKFENDDRVFAEFCAGVHSFQGYTGDISRAHELEAEMARRFLNHPLRRIRQWAQVEHASALEYAQRHREWEDEMNP
jgi:hypothetical protein